MQFHDVQTQQDWQQMYKERGEKIKSIFAEKRAKGDPTGAPPVGYRIVALPNRQKIIEPNPVMQPLVKEAIALYSTKRFSVRELLKIMTEKGLRSRNGKVIGVSGFYYLINREQRPGSQS